MNCRFFIYLLGLLDCILWTHGLDAGSACVMDNSGISGVCKFPQFCPSIIKDYKEKKIAPTVCGWTQTTQIVCCPNTATPAIASNVSRSESYCQQYQQNVYEKVKIHALIADGEDRFRRNDKCGHKQVPLIVGGTAAKPHEFPHMALIGNGDLEVVWYCGGSLVSERWVLTVGHCSQTIEGPATMVRLGEFDKTTTTDDARVQDFRVSENVLHPDYRSSSTYNDIALLQLDRAATLSPYVRPICLPQTREIKESRAIASGWGSIEFGGEKSEILLKVTLELFPQNECTVKYRTEPRWKDGLKEDLQLCAGSRTSIQDTCQGDSGGPLQVYHPNQYCMYTIIGITSFGKACGLAGSPGIYTRVHTYVPWIENIVWPK